MPQYLFHVRDERTPYHTTTGLILPSLKEARRATFVLAGTLLADPSRQFWHTGEWHIDVTDKHHNALLTVEFFRGTAVCVGLRSAMNRHGDAGEERSAVRRMS